MAKIFKTIGSFFSGGQMKAPVIKMPAALQSKPKVMRMPTDQDAESIQEARSRMRSMAKKRKGRVSTILTENLNKTTGSSGGSLGA